MERVDMFTCVWAQRDDAGMVCVCVCVCVFVCVMDCALCIDKYEKVE